MSFVRRLAAAPRAPLDALLAALILAFALLLNGWHLGARSLLGDEAIYGDVARQAAVHGHWYPLVMRGALFVNKPPLAVWPEALSFRVLGISELADRLPSALCGGALVILLYGFASWLLGRWAGLLAAVLLASCRPWLFQHGPRDGVGDPLLCLLLMGALLLYLRYRTTGAGRWLAAAGIAAALSSLIKGLLGPFLLLAITMCWEVLLRVVPGAAGTVEKPAALDLPETADAADTVETETALAPGSLAKRLRAPLMLALGGAVPYLLWLLDTARHRAGMSSVLYRDIVVRATHGIDPAHVQGAGFYLHALGDAFGHWWLAIVPAVATFFAARRRAGPRARAFLLLAVWPVVVVAVLSLSTSKLAWYLDPALPAIATLLAAGCGEIVRGLARWPVLRLAVVAAMAALVASRTVAAWQNLAGPSRVSQMQRFVVAFRQLPRAHLYTGDFHGSPAQYREWNYYYLDQLDGVAYPLPPALPPGVCSVVVLTGRELAARPGLAAATVIPVDKHSPDETDLFIVDHCNGELARRLGNS